MKDGAIADEGRCCTRRELRQRWQKAEGKEEARQVPKSKPVPVICTRDHIDLRVCTQTQKIHSFIEPSATTFRLQALTIPFEYAPMVGLSFSFFFMGLAPIDKWIT